MGRRSRKRESPWAAASPPAESSIAPTESGIDATAPPVRRRSRRGEPPPAPWGKFPVVELCVLTALVIGVIGFLRGNGGGQIMVACAMGLGSLAGLELSIREHFAGYKPHSTVLAGTIAVVLLAVLFFARAPRLVLPPVALVAFGVAFWAFRGVYKRRSGGLGYR